MDMDHVHATLIEHVLGSILFALLLLCPCLLGSLLQGFSGAVVVGGGGVFRIALASNEFRSDERQLGCYSKEEGAHEGGAVTTTDQSPAKVPIKNTHEDVSVFEQHDRHHPDNQWTKLMTVFGDHGDLVSELPMLSL